MSLSNANFKYLLQNVPFELGKDYLHRTFGWKQDIEDSFPLQIFVRYFSDQTKEDFSSLLRDYPQFFSFQSHSSLGARLIFAAPSASFFSILQSLSNSPLSFFAKEIRDEYSPKNIACFQIGEEQWSRRKRKVMGVLNITPDSFSDGGVFYDRNDYASIAEKMIHEGVDIIDIGGESSRPGSLPVDVEEELRRVLPVLTQIRNRFHIPISIDTTKPAVADETLSAGANLINDISGLSAGQKMINVLQKYKAGYCLMHTQGNPEAMQKKPYYDDVVAEVYSFFKEKLHDLKQGGIPQESLLLDPGIGFGKTLSHNLDLLRFLSAFKNLGPELLIGTSRKFFIGKILDKDVNNRLSGTLVTHVFGYMQGATFFRVHDVEECADVLKMTDSYFC